MLWLLVVELLALPLLLTGLAAGMKRERDAAAEPMPGPEPKLEPVLELAPAPAPVLELSIDAEVDAETGWLGPRVRPSAAPALL